MIPRAALISNFKYAIAGAAIGFIAWGHTPVFVAVSILMLMLYFQTQSRLEFFAASMGYYLAASRGLFTGTIVYYDQVAFAFAIWIGSALILSIGWIIFWSNSTRAKPLVFLLAVLLVILPPIGLVGWTNPLLAAGLFFPGWGFFGIVALLASIVVFELYAGGRQRWIVSSMAVFAAMAFNYNFAALKDAKFETVQTDFGMLYDEHKPDFMAEFKRQVDFLALANSAKKDFVLLPENAVGRWTENNMMAWADLPTGKTVFTGASIYDTENPELYDNVLLKITPEGYETLYRQRVPVLVSMWRPWEKRGTNAYLFSQKPVVDVEGAGKIGVMICYEQLLFYTLMETMAYKPERIVAVSNLWWSKGTSIKEIEIASLELTSSLFGVPLAASWNE